MFKILTVFGARPQIIKEAAVARRLSEEARLNEVLVYTGQHRDKDMSDVFFKEFGVPEPTYNLGIYGGGHGEMTGRMLEALGPVIDEVAPAMVLVYGDTNSTLAGSLAAAKSNIPVAHVEAGLRSFNRAMPEEVNRVVVDHLSSLHFCPTRQAVGNLKREGIDQSVHLVGDVMYDAALDFAEMALQKSRILEELSLSEKAYSVATVHRAENTDDPAALNEVLSFLKEKAQKFPVVFPVHPRTRLAVEQYGLSFEGLLITPPLGYLEMTRLLKSAACVFTDSGGLQKEAYFHRVPCVTLRDETEWVETVEAGWNRLWREDGYRPRREIKEYGDGKAAEKIVEILLRFLDKAG